MLRRVLTTDEPIKFLLMSDSSVFEAQLKAARAELEQELESVSDGVVDVLIDVITAVSGNDTNKVFALQAAKEGFAGFIKTFTPDPEAQETAEERFKEALKDKEIREALAYIKATAAINMYRESLDTNDLLESDIEDATWVTAKALSKDELRRCEQAAGERPRLGALLYSQCVDVARKATRDGKDAARAYADHMNEFSEKELRAVAKYEQWQDENDRLVAERSTISIDGFDELTIKDGKYPIRQFEDLVVGGDAIVSEIAKNCRQFSTLGKVQS